jgi:hypothetical protein
VARWPWGSGSPVSCPAFTACSLGLVSTTACAVTFLALLSAQIVARRPASEGVLVIHLNRRGELRLWNTPIRPEELPEALDRARERVRSSLSKPLVVRLVPEPAVPWGGVQALLQRLRPPAAPPSWTLELQLP